jgi:phosphatidylglycerophosphate synthase
MHDSLDRSILRVSLGYAGLQVVVFSAFGIASGFFARYAPAFLATCFAFQAFLFWQLRGFKKDFAIAESGQALERINLANLITLFRVSSLPTLLFLVIASKDYAAIKIPLLVFVFVVFTSDFVDGWVSRTTGQVTRIGKMLDSASDYLVLVVLTVAFYYYHRIGPWFFGLVMCRLSIQALFVAILFKRHGSIRPHTTFLGKAAIASIMLLYGLEIMELIVPVGLMPALGWIQWIAAVIVGASLIDKVIAFVGDFRRDDSAGRATEPDR